MEDYLKFAAACFNCDQRDMFFRFCSKSAYGTVKTDLLLVARAAWNQVGEEHGQNTSSAMDTATAAVVSVAAAFARMEQAALGARGGGTAADGVVAKDAGVKAAGAKAAGAKAAGAKAAGAKAAGARPQ